MHVIKHIQLQQMGWGGVGGVGLEGTISCLILHTEANNLTSCLVTRFQISK